LHLAIAPVGSVFFAFEVLLSAAGFSFDVGVAFAGGGVAGATGFVSSFVAFFSTPPWPLHAPLPALEVVPSLQVTVCAAVEEGVDDADFSAAWVAFLSTPPWPLHAPLPALEVVPSLQTTFAGASAALVRAGTAKRSAANATDDRS
jgi:hypothetical protein